MSAFPDFASIPFDMAPGSATQAIKGEPWLTAEGI